MVFQLIAPPKYKCEVVTLDKVGGAACIAQAVAIIEKEIKQRGGNFKLVMSATRIGQKGDGLDVEDIKEREISDDSASESNEEGMGDLLDDGINNDDMFDQEDQEEEKV